MWPFKKKQQPAQPPAQPKDYRNWNEDWRIGDVAECVSDNWHKDVPPWQRPNVGDRLVVVGFSEGMGTDGNFYYFLRFAEYQHGISTCAFRKVRPVKAEESEIAERILSAKPGADRVRTDA